MEKLRVKAIMDNYDKCISFIEEQLQKSGFDNKAIIKVVTACEEIIVNVMNYAYSPKEGELDIVFEDDVDAVKITFVDNGNPFNPLDNPDVDITLPVDQREIGGLGILMVKKFMDDVNYEYKNHQNILTVMKRHLSK